VQIPHRRLDIRVSHPLLYVSVVVDPAGRRIELLADRWKHIVARHPEMAGLWDAVLRAVTAPTEQLAGRRPGEQWFYLADVGPSRWLKVVINFDVGAGWIITAFPRRTLP
jgi:hypothetical protein